eukprot:s1289_g5.t1
MDMSGVVATRHLLLRYHRRYWALRGVCSAGGTRQRSQLRSAGKRVPPLKGAVGAELAKQRVHEMAAEKKGHAMMVEDDQELDNAVPYRIVCEVLTPLPFLDAFHWLDCWGGKPGRLLFKTCFPFIKLCRKIAMALRCIKSSPRSEWDSWARICSRPAKPSRLVSVRSKFWHTLAGVAGAVGVCSRRGRQPVSGLKAAPGFRELLTFWFGPEILTQRQRLNDIDYLRGRSKMWYMSGTKYDQTAKEFLPLLQMYDPSDLSTEALQLDESVEQNLAKVVLFDQIPRNAYRGTAEAFLFDEAA